MRQKDKKEKEFVQPKYPVLRVSFTIISVFCYVMLGFAALFFIIGCIGIVAPFLLMFLPVSFVLALFAFGLLISVRINQLLQDIEVNTRQIAESVEKTSGKEASTSTGPQA